MSYFEKLPKYKKPGYGDPVKYDETDYLSSNNVIFTKQYELDYSNLEVEFPNLTDSVGSGLVLIMSDPLPYHVSINLTLHCAWECLISYTKEFNKYLSSIGLTDGSTPGYVMSYAITQYAVDVAKPVSTDLDTGFRLVYELLPNGQIIFTNLNYHYYRNSAYSLVDD